MAKPESLSILSFDNAETIADIVSSFLGSFIIFSNSNICSLVIPLDAIFSDLPDLTLLIKVFTLSRNKNSLDKPYFSNNMSGLLVVSSSCLNLSTCSLIVWFVNNLPISASNDLITLAFTCSGFLTCVFTLLVTTLPSTISIPSLSKNCCLLKPSIFTWTSSPAASPVSFILVLPDVL